MPQTGKIEVLSVETLQLSKIFYSKPGEGENIALHGPRAASNSDFLISAFWGAHSASFSLSLSLSLSPPQLLLAYSDAGPNSDSNVYLWYEKLCWFKQALFFFFKC